MTGRGVLVGGHAEVRFEHGSGTVPADIVVEWDLDGDGDFDDPLEDVTEFVLSAETTIGRDFPSQLLGKSGPGRLTVDLTNQDGRFGYFNVNSPLNQPPFSVRTGHRIRVRTVDASNPDPVLLARDEFDGEGDLGTDELGNVWTHVTSARLIRQKDTTGRTLARTDSKRDVAVAMVDVATGDFYAQVKVRVRDAASEAGIVFRRLDAANYGVLYLRHNHLTLGEFDSGNWLVVGDVDVENRTDVTIGVLLEGDQVTAYLEGVPVITGTTVTDPDTTNVGLWGGWWEQRPVSFDEFYVWDRLADGRVEGVLWTGKVTRVTPAATVAGVPTVRVEAEGPLLDAARVEVRPPASVGHTDTSAGIWTGQLVGATLAAAKLLHPPGPIDQGTVQPGSVGLSRAPALDIARTFEEVELGFLHETQEGRIGFEARGARTSTTPAVVFSDQPGAQFGYSALELGDWRRDIINRVTARLAPQVPRLVFRSMMGNAAGAGSSVSVDVPLPGPEHGVEPGDLVLVVIASAVGTPGREWLVPAGWRSFRDAKDALARMRIYGKVLEAGDLGTVVRLFDGTGVSGGWCAVLWVVKRGTWWGSIDQGVEVPDPTGVGQPATVSQARVGLCPSPVVFPSWGPEVSTFLYHRVGMTSAGSVNLPGTISDDDGPAGYGNVGQFSVTNVPGAQVAVQWAVRDACVEVESPAQWPAGSDTFGGFEFVECALIAIRGFCGDPPEVRGGQVVEVNDVASQQAFDAILPHDNPAELFATVEDAEDYGRAVLVRHATERPLLSLTFVATSAAAYRAQAIRRRVGDRVRVNSTHTPGGLGVARDFYIEHIRHSWRNAAKLWEVTWQLSPA